MWSQVTSAHPSAETLRHVVFLRHADNSYVERNWPNRPKMKTAGAHGNKKANLPLRLIAKEAGLKLLSFVVSYVFFTPYFFVLKRRGSLLQRCKGFHGVSIP